MLRNGATADETREGQAADCGDQGFVAGQIPVVCRKDDRQSESTQRTSSLKLLFQVQSLLLKLKTVSARAAFVSGKVLGTEDPEMTLLSLDGIYELLFPKWSSVASERELLFTEATHNFECLCDRNVSIFKITSTVVELKQYSYATWMEAFEKLMNSKYWTRADMEDTAAATMIGGIKREEVKHAASTGEDFEEDRSERLERGRKRSKKIRKLRIPYESEEYSSDEDHYCRNKKKEKNYKIGKKRTKFFHKPIETIEISDSSSEYSGDNSTDSDCITVHRRESSRRYFPKDVVTPDPFDITDNESLKQYLDGFERYFNAKYDGTQRDRTRELARFITGDVKDAYEALGGSKCKYDEMKPALLQWYRTQRVGRTHQNRAELKRASMRTGDTLKLYCMKLQEIAKRAYPNDERECLKQLKRQLVSTVPAWFVRSIEKKEEMKSMLKLGKKITWREIMELAEKYDRKQKKATLCDGSDEELTRKFKDLRCGVRAAAIVPVERSSEGDGRQTKIYRNSQYSQRAEPTMCNYCGRQGHLELNCWRKVGACTICGSAEHGYKECPRYSPIIGRFVPRCSMCSGAHLGQDCPRRVEERNDFQGRQKSPPRQPWRGDDHQALNS